MTPAIRVTRRQARVVAYLLEARHFRYPVSYWDVHRAARVGPATYYPLMTRLETYGWVRSTQEVLPEGAVVPPRTLYALTARGAQWAQEALEERRRRRAFWRRWVMRNKKKGKPPLPVRPVRDAGLAEDIKADRAYWDDKYAGD